MTRRYVPRRLRRDLGPRWHIVTPRMDADLAEELRAKYPWMRAAVFSSTDVVIRRLR